LPSAEDDPSAADRRLVASVIARDGAACRALVGRLTPIVQRRVGRRCEYFSRVRGARLERGQVLDLTQEVLVVLFDNDAAVLRSWDPARGLSLDNYVGCVAEREAAAILRSGRRSAWAETPTASDLIELGAHADGVEQRVTSRDELLEIWHRLEEQLSARGLALFEALLIEERPIDEICERFETTANALYAFRSRVRERLQGIRRALAGDAQEEQS
jgi:RNA polymerase sigma-70 factor (ECF subfamily)